MGLSQYKLNYGDSWKKFITLSEISTNSLLLWGSQNHCNFFELTFVQVLILFLFHIEGNRIYINASVKVIISYSFNFFLLFIHIY